MFNLLAILLSFAMMLTGAPAPADGAADFTAKTLTLSNFSMLYNDQEVVLNPSVSFGVMTDGAQSVFDFSINAGGERLLPFQMVADDSGIVVLNDEMEVQKINPEACRLLRVRAEKDVLGDSVARLMDPAAFQAVRRHPNLQENQRLYMPEYECYMDRTILYNREHHLFICLMHDVSEEMQQQEKKAEMQQQAAAIADGVAKKQLKIVQEIASLLGETAADTLVAIERLKETIADD